MPLHRRRRVHARHEQPKYVSREIVMKQQFELGSRRVAAVSDRSVVRPKQLVLAAAFGLCAAQPAYAYLDPGTGSILLQGLIAAVAAVGVYAGIFWRRIRAFFSRKPGMDVETRQETDQSTKGESD